MKAGKSISERNITHNKKLAELGAMLRDEGETKKYKRLKKAENKKGVKLTNDYKVLGEQADKAHNSERRNNSHLF
jgi:hypothetical protein